MKKLFSSLFFLTFLSLSSLTYSSSCNFLLISKKEAILQHQFNFTFEDLDDFLAWDTSMSIPSLERESQNLALLVINTTDSPHINEDESYLHFSTGQRLNPEDFQRKMLEIRQNLKSSFYIFINSKQSSFFYKRLSLLGADDYCDGFLTWADDKEELQALELINPLCILDHFKEEEQPDQTIKDILSPQIQNHFSQITLRKPESLVFNGLLKRGYQKLN
jgi:hypothetical protein